MAQERKSFFGEEVTPNGTVRRFFQDHFGGDDWDLQIWICQDAEMQYWNDRAWEDVEHEELRRRTDNFDPNTCDTRRVRRELRDEFVNLGRRVNRVPANARRI